MNNEFINTIYFYHFYLPINNSKIAELASVACMILWMISLKPYNRNTFMSHMTELRTTVTVMNIDRRSFRIIVLNTRKRSATFTLHLTVRILESR